MSEDSGLIKKFLVFLLILLAVVTIVCTAETNIKNSAFNDSKLNTSLTHLPDTNNFTLPAPPVNISEIKKTHTVAKDTSGLVSSLAFADVDMKKMGNVVLVPIIPTPEGSGYYYFNTTGNDQSYYIYSSGTYTLQDGFLTGNNSAIYIGASDVVLEGNAQTITGDATNVGIAISSDESNATVRNFSGIEKFSKGIASNADNVSIVNNSIYDNYFSGVYSLGSHFSMQQTVLKNCSAVGVYVYGTDIKLTDNILNNNQGYSVYSYADNVTLERNSINNNDYGVTCIRDNLVCKENTITNNRFYGVGIESEGAVIIGNIISQNGDNLFTARDNVTVKSNTISSSSDASGYGIHGYGRNTTYSENTVNNNGYGIISSNSDCKAINNRVYSNNIYGIILEGNNITVSDNIVRDSVLYGLACYGENSIVYNNIITNATFGVGIVDHYNSSVIGNQINSTSRFGLLILDYYGTTEGLGEIYNNYFGSHINIGGYGNFSNYSYFWTNPAGPQRGTNVVGGPFIAGNYWSNPSGTGWSDQQIPNVSGYTTTSYDKITGINDTAPLVPQKSVHINATTNNWGVIVPEGNSSYRSYTNQTFITQPKPGADITDVVVDSTSQGDVTNWTFTQLTEDHEIRAIGNATPGQVHAIFNASTRYGKSPLTVSFSSEESLGTPTSWYWQFGDGITNTTQNPVHTYVTPGVYSVTLRALNGQTGGYAVWNNYITVTDGPVPEPTPTPVPGKIIAQFSAYPTTGNAPLTVDFKDMSSGNPTSWVWDFGDGAQSTVQNPSHIYTIAGTYPVILSLKNTNYGGSLRISNAVTVT